MIAPLLALVQLFGADDPIQPLRDIQLVHEQPFDLQAEHSSISFRPLPPVRHTWTFAVEWRHELDRPLLVGVILDDPLFLLCATAADVGCRLDLYSPYYWPVYIPQ